jgi:hypothetical protein
MPGVSITDTATPGLKSLRRHMHSPALRSVMARAGVNHVKDHLTHLDRRRGNALGGKRTHFYAAAARSTNFRLQGKGFIISINHVGIAQRYFGGTIRPVTKKRLAIPAQARAHGRRPREFGNLKTGFGKDPSAPTSKPVPRFLYLPGADKTIPRSNILYWLVKSVIQKADHTVLPDLGDLGDKCIEAGGKYLQLQWERSNG